MGLRWVMVPGVPLRGCPCLQELRKRFLKKGRVIGGMDPSPMGWQDLPLRVPALEVVSGAPPY